MQDLLTWLSNYFDFEILQGRPIRIKIKEIYREYQQMPRKLPRQDELNAKKQKFYKVFTIAALGPEFKPNSKMKVARDAIAANKEFNHTSAKAVADRYIKPIFDEYGESDGKKKWVYYETYTLLEEKELEDWTVIRRKHEIDDQEAANAFYQMAQGEDVSKQVSAYRRAMDEFFEKHGDFPVLVQSWRVKRK